MSNLLKRLEVHNFRSLENINITLDPLNIFFGPNGAGKSTLLDAIWFIRDCAIRNVEEASSEREHGIGALWDGADEGANISIQIESELAAYTVTFGYSAGRIESFVGEFLYSKSQRLELITRSVGNNKANFYHANMKQMASIELRSPEKLAITRYLDFEDSLDEAYQIDGLLRYCRFYDSRDADLYRLKRLGSEISYRVWLEGRAKNLWSVLSNLLGQRARDDRYETIMDFMREAFPNFDDLVLETRSANTVYASFMKKGRRDPIEASGESDGHLQMLILLTALFSEGKDRPSLILFDEPEISLHPYPLSVFAKAVKLATQEWNKQVFIATHSPVLISQFDPSTIFAVGIDDLSRTTIQRVSEIEGIQDLLENYAVGSLYMAEMVAAQSKQYE